MFIEFASQSSPFFFFKTLVARLHARLTLILSGVSALFSSLRPSPKQGTSLFSSASALLMQTAHTVDAKKPSQLPCFEHLAHSFQNNRGCTRSALATLR